MDETGPGLAAAPAETGAAAIRLRGISKSFGPVQANRGIDLEVAAGSIHGIVGENGAGKSTLMSILYGLYQPDAGSIEVDGKRLTIRSSEDSIAAGIGMVHQHFMLVDPFTVLENVMLGVEGGPLLAAGQAAAHQRLTELEERYGLEVDPEALIADLPVGLQQRVEILKALYRGARILILDEPTGVLTPQETDRLFEILASLKAQGVTILLITHKLREIMAITDWVSVMRAGQMVAHRQTSETNPEELAELMVGRKVLLRVDKAPAQPGAPALAIEGLALKDERGVSRLSEVNFEVRAGEIVGIAGVAGNGQSELLEVLSGIRQMTSGQVRIGEATMTPETPLDPASCRDSKLAHVPEDRQRMGLVVAFEARESAILGYHRQTGYNGSILQDRGAMLRDTQEMMRDYDVRPPNPQLRCGNFSGGNQQKLVLAREMRQAPLVLLVGQPTRGVDIGAIEFIHRNLVDLRDAGSAILLVSVELDEIMSLSDRILVMNQGRIVGEVPAAEATEAKLGLMMAGASGEEAAA